MQAFSALVLLGLVQAAPLRTDFPYQGRLTDGGQPASGVYDFRLLLFDAVSGGHQIGSALVQEDVIVTNGSFTLSLDFGPAIYTPQPLWLEVGVRPGQRTNDYTLLTPRQSLTPVPRALFSTTAGELLDSSVRASNLLAGAVGTVHLQNQAVTGAKIATGQVVRSLNSMRDDVVLQGGANLTVTQAGNTVTIDLNSITLGSEKGVTITSAKGVTTAYPGLAAALAAVRNGETIQVYARQIVAAQKVYDGAHPEWAGLHLTNRSEITIAGEGSPTIYSAESSHRWRDRRDEVDQPLGIV